MSGFLLDTNIPSETIRPRPETHVLRWLESQPESSLLLSAISIGEIRKGITLLAEGTKRRETEQWLQQDLIPNFRDRIVPVTQSIAERWGVLTAQRQMRGVPLHPADGLIAATALEHDLTLVTRNGKDFMHLGVPLFNPWE